jgi:hypothetical protein
MGIPPQVILSRRISAYLEKREGGKKRGRVRREGKRVERKLSIVYPNIYGITYIKLEAVFHLTTFWGVWLS